MYAIRPVKEKDRETILDITREVGVFTAEDVACVDELLDVYLHEPDSHDYTFVAAYDEDDHILGYTCYGPTPLTEGTFDIYWIAVGKTSQGQGLAKALLEWTEQQLVAQGARLVVLETSSTPEYVRARKFYKRCGYEGRI